MQMTRQEFQKELIGIIILAREVRNPLIRGRILSNQINGLCQKLNLQ